MPVLNYHCIGNGHIEGLRQQNVSDYRNVKTRHLKEAAKKFNGHAV